MKAKNIQRRFLGLAVLLTLLVPDSEAFAGANYPSYTYDEWNTSASAPDSYCAVYSRAGTELECGAFKEPQDLFITKDGKIYIADTGNHRLVVLNTSLELLEVIDSVQNNGVKEELTDPRGLYIDEEQTIYIAQMALGRVSKVKDHIVTQVIERPDHPLVGEDFNFQPSKVGVDSFGRIYVLSKGCYSGLLKFEADGRFQDFYGANKVERTAKVLFQYMWKNFLSSEQREAMTSILPIEYSNLDCGTDGFIYTSTIGTETPKNQIKRLNPLGNNTYFAAGNQEINFGDAELSYNKGAPVQPSFIDLKVDPEGFLFGLDLTHGRIFERDMEGNLIAVFGGLGKQLGTFSTPVAIDIYDGAVFVLDSLKGNITRFEPTEYEQLVRQATICYTEGNYEESAGLWEQVRKRNSNNTLAYIGKGKALSQTGDYQEAMGQLKAGGDRIGYSKAFSKNRLALIRTCAPVGVAVLLFMSVGIRVLIMLKRRKAK